MNANESAFPIGVDCGLTKRELIAAMAMQGMCGGMKVNGFEAGSVDHIKAAVDAADALIAELSKEPK